MFISIDEKAISWFKKEFDIINPASIKMYPQYAGFGEKHKGYSLAFSIELPDNIGFAKEMNGIQFFVESNDVWFFEDAETYLSVNEHTDELQILFKMEQNTILH
ncbi:hypothetical protein HPT25_13200 [Bacillus sp. BRMEA1]|uniref:HesB/YadR/YfhF family protein n=1 Tax=Neobacillus endophyticus TaxID=2738405 RepID=UPI0015660AF9|nr:hypothetical protein [Neobacillus endophyticus]NRD78322.1 hypothetical protein [Neobacillus endophyticus]